MLACRCLSSLRCYCWRRLKAARPAGVPSLDCHCCEGAPPLTRCPPAHHQPARIPLAVCSDATACPRLVLVCCTAAVMGGAGAALLPLVGLVVMGLLLPVTAQCVAGKYGTATCTNCPAGACRPRAPRCCFGAARSVRVDPCCVYPLSMLRCGRRIGVGDGEVWEGRAMGRRTGTRTRTGGVGGGGVEERGSAGG